MRHKAEWYERFNRARAEDVEWMAATGECLTGAAQRLGITPSSLESWCRDHGMQTELEALRDRDIDSLNNLSERGKAGAAARWAS